MSSLEKSFTLEGFKLCRKKLEASLLNVDLEMLAEDFKGVQEEVCYVRSRQHGDGNKNEVLDDAYVEASHVPGHEQNCLFYVLCYVSYVMFSMKSCRLLHCWVAGLSPYSFQFTSIY